MKEQQGQCEVVFELDLIAWVNISSCLGSIPGLRAGDSIHLRDGSNLADMKFETGNETCGQ